MSFFVDLVKELEANCVYVTAASNKVPKDTISNWYFAELLVVWLNKKK